MSGDIFGCGHWMVGKLLASSGTEGFPGGSVARNPPDNGEFSPWIGKIPWRRKWQPTLEFLPGKSQGQRILAGYSLFSRIRVRHDLVTKQ